MIAIILMLHYSFWWNDGGIMQLHVAQSAAIKQEQKLQIIQHDNHVLKLDIQRLESSPEALEERARYILGMIKTKETYYRIIQ